MEKDKLLNRWQVLLHESANAPGFRAVLQERLIILHRLNELGETTVAGDSLVGALETNNGLLRSVDQRGAA